MTGMTGDQLAAQRFRRRLGEMIVDAEARAAQAETERDYWQQACEQTAAETTTLRERVAALEAAAAAAPPEEPPA